MTLLGVCPATTASKYDGTNQGKNAGRYCWKVAGTLCGGKVQGTFADKIMSCVVCDTYKQIKSEEGTNFWS